LLGLFVLGGIVLILVALIMLGHLS
jgi:hypothetical protein